MNMVNHCIKTYQNVDALPTVIDTHHQTVVSGIADLSPVNSVQLRTPVTLMVAPPIGTILTAATECDDSQGTSNRGGHPKGTTNASKQALGDLVREALGECTIEVATLKALALDKTHKDDTGNRCRVQLWCI
jgi:hypothetical protein